MLLGTLAALIVAACRVHGAEVAAPDPHASGAELAATFCATCHGANGNAPPGDVPNLAGQKAGFLRRQLRAFKSHARSDQAAVANMWRVAHQLSERQIDELAARFAGEKALIRPAEGKQQRIAAGQAIFVRGSVAQGVPSCSGCHGPDGNGRGDAPRVAGQHVAYLSRQLKVFQQTNDRPGAAAMRSLAHELTADDIASVAAYLQALPAIGTR